MNNKQEEDIENSEDSMIGTLVFDRYRLIKKLGSGSFGCIYSAEYENQYYAIKLENKNHGQNLLENEAYIMSYLNGPGLPAVKSYGYSSRHNILVMELMGKSLEDIFETFVVKKMSVRCVCNIAYQMMEIMEYIHKKHIIHRDIKPDNFVVGRGEKKKYIYILDFGLAKKYRSSRTLKHNPMNKNKNLIGTARYASINALNGVTQSRRDDLEAIGYVLMYFLRGRLPWQGIPVKNKEERYRKIMEKKMETSAEELCEGFPPEFVNYVNYTRNLGYEQDPDYAFLKYLFINILKKDRQIIDCYYDWDKETITYFRDFANFKKKEKKDKNEDISRLNKTNEISTLTDIQTIPSKNNIITQIDNIDNIEYINSRNNIITNVEQNKNNQIKKLPLNHFTNNKNNNNLTSNISMHKNATISAFNATNYEGSALVQKINETTQNQTTTIDNNVKTNNENANNANLDVQKNNFVNNDDDIKENNAIKENDKIDNNIEQNNLQKKPRPEKDNCFAAVRRHGADAARFLRLSGERCRALLPRGALLRNLPRHASHGSAAFGLCFLCRRAAAERFHRGGQPENHCRQRPGVCPPADPGRPEGTIEQLIFF